MDSNFTSRKPLDWSQMPTLFIPDNAEVALYVNTSSGDMYRLTLSNAEKKGFISLESGSFGIGSFTCNLAIKIRSAKVQIYIKPLIINSK